MSQIDKSDTYQILWLVRRLFRAMGHRAGEYLEGFGITAADRAVLEFLYPDQKLSVPEIASRYKVTRQHVQVTINALLDTGLVKAEENPKHKRSQLILLSDRGRDLFEKIRVREKKEIEILFSDISATRRKQTRQTLELLLKNIS